MTHSLVIKPRAEFRDYFRDYFLVWCDFDDNWTGMMRKA